MPRKKKERKWRNSSRPQYATSHETARSLANDPSGGGPRGNSPGIAASPISLLSMVALEESVGGA